MGGAAAGAAALRARRPARAAQAPDGAPRGRRRGRGPVRLPAGRRGLRHLDGQRRATDHHGVLPRLPRRVAMDRRKPERQAIPGRARAAAGPGGLRRACGQDPAAGSQQAPRRSSARRHRQGSPAAGVFRVLQPLHADRAGTQAPARAAASPQPAATAVGPGRGAAGQGCQDGDHRHRNRRPGGGPGRWPAHRDPPHPAEHRPLDQLPHRGPAPVSRLRCRPRHVRRRDRQSGRPRMPRSACTGRSTATASAARSTWPAP